MVRSRGAVAQRRRYSKSSSMFSSSVLTLRKKKPAWICRQHSKLQESWKSSPGNSYQDGNVIQWSTLRDKGPQLLLHPNHWSFHPDSFGASPALPAAHPETDRERETAIGTQQLSKCQEVSQKRKTWLKNNNDLANHTEPHQANANNVSRL